MNKYEYKELKTLLNDNNSITEVISIEPFERVTTHDQAKELHELLVQTCIDYIKKNNLTDIDTIFFSADGIQDSVKESQWMPGTDSSLELKGITIEKCKTSKGKIIDLPISYEIEYII